MLHSALSRRPLADSSVDEIAWRSPLGRERVAVERYEIIVKGRVSPSTVATIEGFEVVGRDPGMTRMVGWIPDQARLHGILRVLHNLNIELESVNRLPP